MFDSGVILKGKIRCKSLSGIKGLNKVIKKIITFDSSKYLNMRVTFDVFTLQDDQAEDGLKKE